MLPQEIVRKKRDGLPLADSDIQFFVQGMTDGSITEGQIAAFGMSVYFQGMTPDECATLTRAMTDSGTTMAWDLDGPVLDKHSTGGVGDLVSLVLGPMIAACGGYVPMISGRGLGHTGGTLDKLESIPGYNARPRNALFKQTVREAGVAIIGQTGNLAPADGRFYAIRDITATVESIPLITASILSKKLAAGLDALVMDVKSGSGAFMPTQEASLTLAEFIVSVAGRSELPTSALVTCMNEPLAPCAGNALEVREAVRYLTGERQSKRLDTVVMALCSEMLILGGLAVDAASATEMLRKCLDSGLAAERFGRMIDLLGGPNDFLDKCDCYLPVAGSFVPILAVESGYVSAWDTRALGLAVVMLGGGRSHVGQAIDPAVGLTDIVRVGQYIQVGDPVAFMHINAMGAEKAVREMVLGAVRIGSEKPEINNMIQQHVSIV